MMIKTLSRRLSLKIFALGSLFGLTRSSSSAQEKPESKLDQLENWSNTNDRVFLGGEVWANPMEDWRGANGWAECITGVGNRSVHSLTHQLTNATGRFSMSVRISRADASGKDGGAGFKIGVRSDLNEHRSNCFAQGGVIAGLVGAELKLAYQRAKLSRPVPSSGFRLNLTGTSEGGKMKLVLQVTDENGAELGSIHAVLPAEKVLGNIAVVSNFEGGAKKRTAVGGYRFSGWKAGGDAFTVNREHTFGPLLWTMFTLTDSRSDKGFVLRLTALTGPMGMDDSHGLLLYFKRGGKWDPVAEAKLDRDAWTATWPINHWDEKEETQYKVVYTEIHKDKSMTEHEWTGVIKPNPSGRPLRLGALTCQNDYAFPYAPVAENVVKLDPDMLYFSGDQIYERHGGFGIIRDPAGPAILNYLRKYYQFGWAFREAMKDRPTVCIPDDHDVFQGNIWGEGGAKMKEISKGVSSKGGYREPARMVNAVHRTNTSHHPPAFDSKPSKQDISVYYGDLVYGNVSFAILGDRQWKSGPERVETGSGRADHVADPDFDTSKLDKPGLVLLGERQEEFLRQWSKDWRGHTMKVLLSQTVFSGVATHHGRGGKGGYLKADLDSGAWPQTPRNNAIKILRESMALHVNGDQHLTTLSQYGVDAQRDSNWSFCTPAIAVGYPRFWLPDEVGMPHQNRPRHGLANTGEFLDGCGNKVYVFAVGNPEPASLKHRYELAHQKGSGFGLVTIDTKARTYKIDSFRFLIDVTDGKASNQFPGWPVTIHQSENRGENKLR